MILHIDVGRTALSRWGCLAYPCRPGVLPQLLVCILTQRLRDSLAALILPFCSAGTSCRCRLHLQNAKQTQAALINLALLVPAYGASSRRSAKAGRVNLRCSCAFTLLKAAELCMLHAVPFFPVIFHLCAFLRGVHHEAARSPQLQ